MGAERRKKQTTNFGLSSTRPHLSLQGGAGKTRDPGNEVSKLPEARKSASDCDVTIAFSIESD